MVYVIAFSITFLLMAIIQVKYLKIPVPEKNKKTFGRIHLEKYSLRRTALFFISSLPLFFISALRYGIGTDYFYGYVPCFNVVKAGRFDLTSLEKGYVFLNYIVSLFTSDYQWIFVVTSGIFVFLCFKTIERKSRFPLLALIIFYLSFAYLDSYNTIRQSIACAIILISSPLILTDKKRDKLVFLLFLVLAMQFHRASIVYGVMLLLVSYNFEWPIFAISIAVVYGFRYTVIERLKEFLGSYIRYEYYFSQQSVGRGTSNYVILANILILVMLIYIEFRNDNISQNKEWRYIKWMQYNVIMLLPFDGIIGFAGRAEMLFMFPQFITIPNAILMHNYPKERRWMTALVIVLYLVEFIFFYTTNRCEVFPYVSIFQK